MEWVLLLVVALGTALYIRWPRLDLEPSEDHEITALRDRHALLLAELREFDTDLANGRITEDDRRAGRHALAPELREITERLRELGESNESAPATPASSD